MSWSKAYCKKGAARVMSAGFTSVTFGVFKRQDERLAVAGFGGVPGGVGGL